MSVMIKIRKEIGPITFSGGKINKISFDFECEIIEDCLTKQIIEQLLEFIKTLDGTFKDLFNQENIAISDKIEFCSQPENKRDNLKEELSKRGFKLKLATEHNAQNEQIPGQISFSEIFSNNLKDEDEYDW